MYFPQKSQDNPFSPSFTGDVHVTHKYVDARAPLPVFSPLPLLLLVGVPELDFFLVDDRSCLGDDVVNSITTLLDKPVQNEYVWVGAIRKWTYTLATITDIQCW